MFIDANQISDSEIIQSDVCVIGGGAAGITIARKLSERKVNVCLLESGGFNYVDKAQSLYDGKNIGRDYFPLTTTRLRFFGGSTNHWGGMCGQLDESDFLEREWIANSGWPIKLNDLLFFYKEAHEICGLKSDNYDIDKFESDLNAPQLFSDKSMFESEIIRFARPITRFGAKYKNELGESEYVKVILNANVLEIISSENGESVSSVMFSTFDKKKYRVKAKGYVLAAGGIENPRILLLSRGSNQTGLGNENNLVGKNFIEHPKFRCGEIYFSEPGFDRRLYDEDLRRRRGVNAHAVVRPTYALQKKEKISNVNLFLGPVEEINKTDLDQPPDNFVEKVGRYLTSKEIIDHQGYNKYFRAAEQCRHTPVFGVWEQVPNFLSSVTLGDEKDYFGQNKVTVDWQFTDSDFRNFNKSLELFANELGESMLGRFKIDVSLFPGYMAGHHHMGTTRMNNNPKLGVVDENCKVHGKDNLFVAGSSVFPTGGAINPTLTIVALSLRLSKHLIGSLA